MHIFLFATASSVSRCSSMICVWPATGDPVLWVSVPCVSSASVLFSASVLPSAFACSVAGRAACAFLFAMPIAIFATASSVSRCSSMICVWPATGDPVLWVSVLCVSSASVLFSASVLPSAFVCSIAMGAACAFFLQFAQIRQPAACAASAKSATTSSTASSAASRACRMWKLLGRSNK